MDPLIHCKLISRNRAHTRSVDSDTDNIRSVFVIPDVLNRVSRMLCLASVKDVCAGMYV